ncbi:hypothetical protein [Diaphorobacter caeni]|uniref:hypothetical protein n=1 Tax=Diaphorobacter caeni TaxID=2784387 RepID=UPI00188F802A|nr:hypothetical protein [Diaphorobacter caeni]MBF5005356.1 hypothetical protein [Diaphorobacter caeni]
MHNHQQPHSANKRRLIAACAIAACTAAPAAFAQNVIFLDTFGASTTRTTSPYVPQAYMPAIDLPATSKTFSHGSTFYKFANLGSTDSFDKFNRDNIDNGYYAVGNPDNLRTGASFANEGWYQFQNTAAPGGDYTGTNGGTTAGVGAVLAVNAGEIQNEYYRRAASLTPGATYRLSAAFYITNSSASSRFEVQHGATGELLAKSDAFGSNGIGANYLASKIWHVKELTFTVPATCASNANYSIALRNLAQSNSDNDFYVDDIQLVELSGPAAGASTLTCPTAAVPSIAAIDDGTWTIHAGESSSDSVRTNDTLTQADGTVTPITSSNTSIRQTTTVTGLTLREDGYIDVASGTPAGTYSVPYEICIKPETKPWPTCATAEATITVPSTPAPVRTPELVATPDDYTSTPTAPGGKTPSVITNDSSDGTQLTPSDVGGKVTVKLVGADPDDFKMDPTDGTITVGTGVPPGTYTLTYEVCAKDDSTNCKTTTVTILVQPLIDATDDDFSAAPTPPGGKTPSVLGNDTLDGMGNPSPQSDVSVSAKPGSPPPTGFLINPDGTISVDPSVPSGDYSVPYRICAVSDATLCDDAVVTIKVAPSVPANPPVIVATTDDFTTVPTAPGKSTPSVLGNDTLNSSGNPTPGTEVIVSNDPTIAPPTGFSIEPDGTITVDPSVTPGDYSVPYQICVANTLTPCSTAVANIKVGTSTPATPPITTPVNPSVPPTISASDDDFSVTPIQPGQSTTSVLGNDTLNGSSNPVPKTDVIVSNHPDPLKAPPSGFTINPDGTISVDSSVKSGFYDVPYQICAASAPTVCATAMVTVQVSATTVTTPTPGTAHSVPSLGTWALLMLSTLIGAFTLRRREQR